MPNWMNTKGIVYWTDTEKNQYISLTLEYLPYLECLLERTGVFLGMSDQTSADVGKEMRELQESYDECMKRKDDYNS